MAPRFQGDAFGANLALVKEIVAVAAAKKANAGQVALAWVLSRGGNIVTIPGTTKLTNLESNIGAADIVLAPAEVERLDALAAKVQGERYNERGMAAVNV